MIEAARSGRAVTQRQSVFTRPQVSCRVGVTPQEFCSPGVGGQPVPLGVAVPV